MKGGKVFQERVCFANGPQINSLDILVTFIAEVDTVGLLSLTTKIL
jgi:hypothetical protein